MRTLKIAALSACLALAFSCDLELGETVSKASYDKLLSEYTELSESAEATRAEYAAQAVKRNHSTTLQAAQVALEAGVKKLIIAHYSSRSVDASLYEAECRSIFPETFAASDGDVFEI